MEGSACGLSGPASSAALRRQGGAGAGGGRVRRDEPAGALDWILGGPTWAPLSVHSRRQTPMRKKTAHRTGKVDPQAGSPCRARADLRLSVLQPLEQGIPSSYEWLKTAHIHPCIALQVRWRRASPGLKSRCGRAGSCQTLQGRAGPLPFSASRGARVPGLTAFSSVFRALPTSGRSRVPGIRVQTPAGLSFCLPPSPFKF